MNTFTVPKKLFNKIPHFLDRVCSTQQNVFPAIAMATIFPGVCVIREASRMLVAKDTAFAAVFSRIINVIPYMHVARNSGLFSM